MPIKICDLAPRYWKATHPDWDPNDPKEWELPECPHQHEWKESTLFSLLEKHEDGSWWYHPGWTADSEEGLMSIYEEKRSLELWKDREMQPIVHHKPFKQDRSCSTFDFETFREVSGYEFKLDEEKTFEQECAEGYFEFKPDRSFEERCEIVRRTPITLDMTYEERLAALKARYGL